MILKKFNNYQKLAVITVIATLFLILVGGLVRAAGAGLGCPDWPTCFGLWIPPVSIDQLPAGFDAEQFNVFHTWLEYVNRLTGVTIGFLITLTFIFSFRYRKSDPVITWSSAAAFVLVLVQGWLGGRVVQSGLQAGMITLHMFLALLIVNILIFTAYRATRGNVKIELSAGVRRQLLGGGVILMILFLVQMVLGTQVREMVDVIKNAPVPLPRGEWLEQLNSWLYPVHRSFSWLVVLAGGWFWWLNYSHVQVPALRRLANWTALLILLQIALGIAMDWVNILGVFQLSHLMGMTLLISLLFIHLLLTLYSRTPN